MFNRDMAELGEKRSVIREIFEYSRIRKQEIGAENVFDFSIGNPNVPTPAAVTETMKKLIDETSPVDLHGYTSAAGDPSVVRRIAKRLGDVYGVEADPSLIYMTCGAAAALSVTMRAMALPGEEIIVPAPYFPEYRVFAKNAGLIFREVPSAPDFQPDVDAIRAAVNEKTRAILLNYPNNPTGAVIREDVLLSLSEMLRQKSEEIGHPIYIISDEPYREFLYDGAVMPSIPKAYADTVVCYSYSKSLSLPGERIGYIFIPSRLRGAKELFFAVCGAGRSLGYVCAPSFLQYTVALCDGIAPDLSSYAKNRDLLYRSLTQIGFECVRPDGAFYLFMKSPEADAAAFAERAKKYELLLVPSDSFGCPGYVRLAYCVSYAMIERSIPAFAALYREYQGENQ